MKINRRIFTLGATVAAATSFVKPSSLFAADLAGKKFTLATYGGSYRDGLDELLIGPLTQQGLQVDYVLGNPDDNLAKLIAAKRTGQVPFDVMDSSSVNYPNALAAGFLEKIDYDAVPGAKNSPSWVREEAQLVTVWSPEGIVYNEEKFREAGIPVPESYLDLSNPKLKGRVAFPSPGNVFHWAAVVGLAKEGGGDEANMAPAISLIKEIDPVYFYSASVELATKFGAGDIWAAPFAAGWAVRLKRSGLPIAVAYPAIGEGKGSLWPGPLSIIKGTENIDAAYAYLQQWYSVEAAAKFCASTGSMAVDPVTRKRMAEIDPLAGQMLPMSDEAIERSYRIQWANLDAAAWRNTWNREIQN